MTIVRVLLTALVALLLPLPHAQAATAQPTSRTAAVHAVTAGGTEVPPTVTAAWTTDGGRPRLEISGRNAPGVVTTVSAFTPLPRRLAGRSTFAWSHDYTMQVLQSPAAASMRLVLLAHRNGRWVPAMQHEQGYTAYDTPGFATTQTTWSVGESWLATMPQPLRGDRFGLRVTVTLPDAIVDYDDRLTPLAG